MARGGSANLAGAFVNGVVGFLLVLVVTRTLDKAAAGTFFALTSVFLIVLAAVELGATTGVARWIPHYLALGRARDVRAVLRAALGPVLVVSTVTALLAWPLAPAVLSLLGGGADAHPAGGPIGAPIVDPAVLRALAAFLPVAACYDILLAATRGFHRIRPTLLVERLGRVPVQFLLVVMAAGLGGGVLAVGTAWALPYLPALLIVIWLTARLLLAGERGGRPSPAAGSDQGSIAGEFWRYTWARGLSRIFQVALQRADIVLIAAMLTPRDAAVYTAATRLVPVGLLGVQAVQQVLQPSMSRLLALGDLAAAGRIYRASTAWATAMAWPIYCTAAAFAPQILRLFGPGYDAGSAAMVWVCLAMLVGTACGAADLTLLMSGRSTLSLWNTAVALAADILLNLLLLPRIGITGAGMAWATAILLTNLPPLAQVRRYVGLTPFSRGALLVATASALVFGAGSLLALRLLGSASLFPAALWVLPATAIYLGVLSRAGRLLELHRLAPARIRRSEVSVG
ncbi:MAG TPA: lipopolysaccharide biosynthesis protein [Streptosporangiaceae bacterium]|nr:lipopolysaccharide biosynthesis protein [Streptosporangiaceae bacterium]